ncbi:MAG: transrane protein [Gammaproteobacteria bacterium]|nr:transrane protein [Gammaproteobacteria bacterium]
MWLPLVVTFLVLRFIVDLLDKTVSLLPEHYQPAQWLGFNIPGTGVVFSILILLITGMLVTNFLGKWLVAFSEQMLQRIPLVRSLYSGVKQVVTTLFSSDGQSFRKVMLVEYPRTGMWTIAFLTGQGFKAAEEQSGEPVYTLFVPTTPNPTSGFLIIVPKKDAVELDLSIDDALKMVISLGAVRPAEEKI